MPRAAKASIGPLASWSTLGLAGVREPAGQRLLVGDVELGRCVTYAAPSSVANASAVRSPVPARQWPTGCMPTRAAARAWSASQPASSPASSTRIETSKPESSIVASSSVGIASSSRVRSTWNSRPSKSVCTACRSHDGQARSVRPGLEVEVADQRVETAVADHVAEVLAQRLTLLAGDLVGMGDDVVEAVVLVDPLRRVALAHAGHARQVVGGLADQRGELRIALGRDRRSAPRRRPASSAPCPRRRAWGRSRSTGR